MVVKTFALIACYAYRMHHHPVTHCCRTSRIRSGFTLIEISIVLVIVGLIIGGIIIGRDMIRSAAIRATISQYDMFNTEVRTFRLKYNAVPGDILPRDAASFGFLTLQGGSKCGDGNSFIESANQTLPLCGNIQHNVNAPAGEQLAFWRHLSDANLVGSLYGSDLSDDGTAPCEATSSCAAQTYLPSAKLDNGLSFMIFSNGGVNFFGILPIQQLGEKVSAHQYKYIMPTSTTGTAISPVESYSIDTKIDDGLPNTGHVLAITPLAWPQQVSGSLPNGRYGIGAPSFAASATANTCMIGSGAYTDTYNLDLNNGGNDGSCALGLMFQ